MNRRTVSLAYLVLQTLALIEYSAFMSGSVLHVFLCPLFVLSLLFYAASLTFLTLLHPALCVAVLVRRMVRNQKKGDVAAHLACSIVLASSWWIMFKYGWVLSV